jgi:hypothetical protein
VATRQTKVLPLTYVNGPDRPSAILTQGCKQ